MINALPVHGLENKPNICIDKKSGFENMTKPVFENVEFESTMIFKSYIEWE